MIQMIQRKIALQRITVNNVLYYPPHKDLSRWLAFSNPLNNRGLLDANMMVNKYWLPDLVFGDGPTHQQ